MINAKDAAQDSPVPQDPGRVGAIKRRMARVPPVGPPQSVKATANQDLIDSRKNNMGY